MSSLLENIINKNSKLSFNFSKSLNENIYHSRYESSTLPIEPESSSTGWEEYRDNEKSFITKTYNFNRFKHVNYFISEVLDYCDIKMLFPEIIIKEYSVNLSLYTKDINEVTETDIECSRFADEVFNEINYVMDI